MTGTPIVEEMNKRNKKLYGQPCNKCEYYPGSCRCLTNDTWKNKELTDTLQRVYTKLNNKDYFKDQSMSADIQVLGKDLLTVLHHIELSGVTVDEVLKHVDHNFEHYG